MFNTLHGALLLACYALGMALPMFVLALLWDRFDLGRKRWLRGRSLTLGPLTVHTTSLIGGALFMLLGAVFLLFDGTSALPSLMGVETEAAMEERLAAVGRAIPDRVLLLAVAALAMLTAVLLLLRPREVRKATAEADPENTPERPC
jgi:hypothetical protein